MNQVKRGWDLLPKEKKEGTVDALMHFFATERDETIGMLAAEEILDFVLQMAGSEIYNQGIEDSQKLIEERFQDLSIEMGMLKKEN